MPNVAIHKRLREAEEDLLRVEKQYKDRPRNEPGALLMQNNLLGLIQAYQTRVSQLQEQMERELGSSPTNT